MMLLPTSGSRTHWCGFALYRSMAETAPGSYGVMYVLDDDRSGTWERWVMKRGNVSREQDASPSPHIGVVEDIHDGG